MKYLYFCISLIVFTLLASSCKRNTVVAEVIDRPNVIIITTDQWRASSLGYNGNEQVRTPHLDSLAHLATNFKNAVSVTPVCTPSRASLLTGKYPTTTGMFLNDLYLPKEELTIAEIYNNAGYETGYIGKWHLDGHGRYKFVAPERRQGFDYWKASECDHSHNKEHYYLNADTTKHYWEGYSPFAMAKSAIQYIDKKSEGKEPFLLVVSMSTPHYPHETALKEYRDMYPEDDLLLPANVPEEMEKQVRKELSGYYAHCSATDAAIGQIIRKIKSIGLFDSSIILFTSDHGDMMGAHGYHPKEKHQSYRESANIPFLISYPDKVKTQGKVAEAPITTPDILPTLLSLSGIHIPDCIEGYDLSDIVKTPSLQKDRAALFMNICPFGSAFENDEYRAIKTANYTYVKTPEGPSMLYHDSNDPNQMNNLVDEPAMSAVQNKLDQKLMEELKRIGEGQILPREYYTEKFGYEGREQIKQDYTTRYYYDVEDPNTPKLSNEAKVICDF